MIGLNMLRLWDDRGTLEPWITSADQGTRRRHGLAPSCTRRCRSPKRPRRTGSWRRGRTSARSCWCRESKRFGQLRVGYVSRMAVTDSREIVIEATPDEIMDVLFDLESLPEWSSAHQKVEVLERDDQGHPSKSRQVVKIVGVSDEQVLAYSVHDDGVSWTLVSAKQQRAQDARYTLTPRRRFHPGPFRTHRGPHRAGPRIPGQKRNQGSDGHRHRGPAQASARSQEGRLDRYLLPQRQRDTVPMESMAASTPQRIGSAIGGLGAAARQLASHGGTG